MAAINETSAYLSWPRCFNCNNHLSYFPIFLIPNGNICGRCPIPPSSVRNEVYENFAAFQKFPCRYQKRGCTKELLPIHMKTHEKLCRDREITCPKSPCNWRGSFVLIIEHYIRSHPRCLEEHHRFAVDMANAQKNHLLDVIIIKNKTFAVKINCEILSKNLMQFSLIFEGIENQKQSYCCNAYFQIGTLQCKTVFEVSIPEGKKIMALKANCFESTIISGGFKFWKTKEDFEKDADNFLKLSNVKCVVCRSCEMSPIQYRNKIYCFYCLKQNFPYAVVTPDMILVDLTSTIKFPCVFKSKGCNFVETPKLMKAHCKTCDYSHIKCYYTGPPCLWTGRRIDIPEHIVNTHKICLNGVIVPGTFKGAGVIAFDKYLFWVVFMNNNSNFFSTTQLITGTSKKFKYQMDIYHQKNNRKVVVQKPCCVFYDPIDFDVDNNINNCFFIKNQLDFYLGINKTSVDFNDIFIKVEIFRDY